MAAGRENRDGRRGRRDRGGGGLTEVEADQPGAEASGGGLDGVEADRSAQRQINPAQRWIGPAWRQSSWPSPSPNPRHREEAREGGHGHTVERRCTSLDVACAGEEACCPGLHVRCHVGSTGERGESPGCHDLDEEQGEE